MTTSTLTPYVALRFFAFNVEAAGLAHQFVITPNIGHWYPAELGHKIDAGIAFIRQNQKKEKT